MLNKQLDQAALQAQVQWKHPERPVLKSWVILARNYNTKVTNIMELIIAVIFGSAVILFYVNGVDRENWFSLASFLSLGAFIVFSVLLVSNGTRSKKLFVYRLTAQGFEVASWKNNVERIKKFFIGICVFSFCACLMIVIIFPQAFFLLFVGPTGYVFISLSMMGNKGYWERQRQFSQGEFNWSDPIEYTIYKKRNIIFFTYDREKLGRNPYAPLGELNIFCYKQDLNNLIDFIKQTSGNTNFKEGVIDVSECAC